MEKVRLTDLIQLRKTVARMNAIHSVLEIESDNSLQPSFEVAMLAWDTKVLQGLTPLRSHLYQIHHITIIVIALHTIWFYDATIVVFTTALHI